MCKMSDSSHKSFKPSDDPCEEENTKKSGDVEKNLVLESNNAGRFLREKVLKEVGLTSKAFIGPAFPPPASSAKSDLEDSLSLFYKELEKIDTQDGLSNYREKEDGQRNQNLPELASSKRRQDVPDGKIISTSSSAGNNHSNSGPNRSSWTHWYQNEPLQFKRQRPIGNQWDYTGPPDEPPYPRYQRPPFPQQAPQPAYSAPQNGPAHIEVNRSSSGMKNRHHMDFNPSPLSSIPPPDAFIRPPQSYSESPPPHFGWNEQSFCDTDPNYVPARWSGDRREEWQHWDEDYDRPPRIMSENTPWKQQHHYQPFKERCGYQSGLVLILMRGLPGSGKTTLARELLSSGPSGIILSTDDYFAQSEGYCYDPGLLGAAHEWNQSKAKEALHSGRSPIIIDNTNLQAWEMKPYVQMALERGYKVDFREPDTRWKFDPYELEKRNKHGVPHEKIAQMLDRFSSPVSIDIVMNSQEPAHVNQRRPPEQPQIRKNMYYF